MKPYEAFQTYLALKQHFTNDSYDYFKYNGRVRVNKESFDVRKDRFFFAKLAKKFHNRPEDLRGYLVANLLANSKAWIGVLVGVKAEEIYLEWKKKNQSLSYQIDSDVAEIADTLEDCENMFVCINGQHPPLLSLYTQEDITLETLIAFDLVFDCFKSWNKKIEDTIIWPEIYQRCQKYKPFLNLEKRKYKEIMKKHFLGKQKKEA